MKKKTKKTLRYNRRAGFSNMNSRETEIMVDYIIWRNNTLHKMLIG